MLKKLLLLTTAVISMQTAQAQNQQEPYCPDVLAFHKAHLTNATNYDTGWIAYNPQTKLGTSLDWRIELYVDYRAHNETDAINKGNELLWAISEVGEAHVKGNEWWCLYYGRKENAGSRVFATASHHVNT